MARTEQVIRLDGEEDIQAVRSIITRAQAERVLLDVPRRHPAFRSAVRLKLLARQAYAVGVELALVSRDPTVRELAREVQLPVFRSVGAAQKAGRWPQPHERVPAREIEDTLSAARAAGDGHHISTLQDITVDRRHVPPTWQRGRPGLVARHERMQAPANWADRFALLGLVLGVLVVLFVGIVLIVPSAQITLIPAQSEISTEFEAIADTDADLLFFSEGRLPAERLSIIVEGTAQTATSGRKDVPDERATGEVVFVNLLPQDVPIPGDTIVSTSAAVPVRFRTTEEVVVPANGRMATPIEAVNPGLAGNVAAFLINRVEGPASTAVRVFNPAATQGGTVRPAQIVTAADKDQLREQLSQRLIQEGQTALEARVPEEKVLIPGTVQFEPVTESFDHLIDEQADVLTLLYRLRVTGKVIARRDLERIGQRALREAVPPNRNLLGEGMSVEPVGGKPLSEEETRLTVRATGVAAAQITGGMVQEIVRGQPIDEARAALEQRLPLAATPAVEVNPSWWDRMPYLPLRIFVRVAALSPATEDQAE